MDSLVFIWQAVLIGIGATLILDLWQLVVNRMFGVPPTNWAFVGRWISYIPQGKIFHEAIAKSVPVKYEAATGWLAHYLVGIIYAAIYLAAVRFVFGWEPGLITALGFGIVTVVAPWFLMQPGMGLGIMAKNAPKAGVIRLHSLSSHIAFGAGLYLSFLSIWPMW